MGGFTVRRCSWLYEPIMSLALTDRMVRWLDLVCLKQVAFRGKFDGKRHSVSRGTNGT